MGVVFAKILRVNLTTKAVAEESAQKYEERFIGGRGVNSFILFNEVKPETEPFDPENYLIFGAGPLAGSAFPSSAFTIIGAKNVFTNGINWASAGGHFASELRHAGWGNIVISGKSPKPVYLYIKDDHVEIRDASHLWGKDTWETQDIIRQEIGDPRLRFATIGPAGENLVRGACLILGRTRAAGSGGIGAVMGSKNLKTIAVRGTQKTRIANPEKFEAVVRGAMAKLDASPVVEIVRNGGTIRSTSQNEMCVVGTRNTQDDHDDSWTLIDYSAYRKTGNRIESCWNCPIECGFGEMETHPKGPYAGLKINSPEANTVFAYGCRMDVHDPDYILKCFELLSRYGLCNDTTGVVIGWAFECFEKGLLTKDDTDGLDLTWGNGKAVIELIRKITYREGSFGNLLAEGCKRASEVIGKGSIYYCSHLKGQDNLDTPRSCKAWGLGNNTSLRGGRHLDGAPGSEFADYSPEECEKVWGVLTASEATNYEGKGKLVAWHTKYKAAIDSLGVCYFTSQWMHISHLTPEDYAKALSAASGREISGEELMRVGDRIHNVEKAFNTLHAGFTRKDDYPPLVYMREPIKSGKYKGEKVDIEEYAQMLDEFYEAKGWDRKTSWQRQENLAKLELPEVIERLQEVKKLL